MEEETVEEEIIKNLFGEEKQNWIKNMRYESLKRVWDSRNDREVSAYYFGYSEKEDAELFLRRNEEEVEIFVISGNKCRVRHWDGEVHYACMQTRYIGNYGKIKEFPSIDEKNYILQRLKKLEKLN